MLLCPPAGFPNTQHKTDGSHTNRPFFLFRAGHAGKHLFTDKSTAPQCLLFLFFKKRNRPLLFFLEEKKQKKINCGAAFLLCSCRFRQRAAQNGRFTYEPSVFLFRAGHAGKHLFTDKSTAPQCLLFLFFKKRNRSPVEEKKSFPPLVSPSHGAGVTAGAGLIVGSSCARYASTISSTDSSFRMMEISMRRLRVRPASVAFVSTGRVAP